MTGNLEPYGKESTSLYFAKCMHRPQRGQSRADTRAAQGLAVAVGYVLGG